MRHSVPEPWKGAAEIAGSSRGEGELSAAEVQPPQALAAGVEDGKKSGLGETLAVLQQQDLQPWEPTRWHAIKQVLR